MTSTPRRVHYVLSTHWDREWYEPFQFYRFRLVRLIDEIIDGLADGRLKGPFTTDGQAIILDDYLEVRPERRALVEEHVRTGRFKVGPWYVLPDEFIVSGEALIRNIRLGRQIAREYGGVPSKAGFVCDLFGHISQLPQIFAGFGIQTAFTWRGINLDHQRNYIWTGADGTQLVAHRYSAFGYSDYSKEVRETFDHAKPFDAARCDENIDRFAKFLASETAVDSVLFFDGGDHLEWDPLSYAVLAERFGKEVDGLYFLHSTLDDYSAELVAQKGRITERREGELREPGKTHNKACHLIPGVLSSRVWIKQQNAYCQDTLCLWAEPLGVVANHLLGREYPAGFLNVAWKTLLQNHPHDSICGCSVDQVHEDMKARFSQVQQIADRLVMDATRKITASVDMGLEEGELRIGLFNPLPYELDETVEVTLDIPEDWPIFGEFFNFEHKPGFRLYKPDGTELPYQRVGQAMKRQRTRIWPKKFPQPYKVNEVRVSIAVRIPAMGYTTLVARKSEPGLPTRHPQDKGLAVGRRAMENEFLRVEFSCNGTFTLTDKQTGNVYTGLNAFEDNADIGDGWYHGVAVNDQVYDSSACAAEIAMLENGPNVTAFRVRTHFNVPAYFDFSRMVRSEQHTELIIESTVRLRRGSRHVEVETRLQNTVKDHRLRAVFPTGAREAKTFWADSAFDMIERPIALRADNHEYSELEVETKPMQTWSACLAGGRGLAIISQGQLETAVRDHEDRPLALTLFRSTGRTVLTDGEPNGQLLMPLSFRYWVTPLSASLEANRLFRLGQRLATGLRVVQQQPLDLWVDSMGRKLPAEDGHVALSGDAVMTSFRHVDGALEVRLFNPHPHPVPAHLAEVPGSCALSIYTSATLVDLESRSVGGPLKLQAGRLDVELRPKEIATIRLVR